MTDIFKLPVHPAADVFPMLEDDDLNLLAEDIKQNGLIHPIVVKEGMLIDGRNRREACKRAGVTPETVELDGQDPTLYVLQSNIARRHMTKSAQAMAVAMVYPEAEEKGGRGKKTVPKFGGVLPQRLAEARRVLHANGTLAKQVLAGTLALYKALEQVEAAEAYSGNPEKRLVALRKRYADLAERVEAGEAELAQAEQEAIQRAEEERKNRVAMRNALEAIERNTDALNREWMTQLMGYCRDFPKEFDYKWIGEFISNVETNIAEAREVYDQWQQHGCARRENPPERALSLRLRRVQ